MDTEDPGDKASSTTDPANIAANSNNLTMPVSGGYADPTDLEADWLSSETEKRAKRWRKIGARTLMFAIPLSIIFLVSASIVESRDGTNPSVPFLLSAGVLSVYISLVGIVPRLSYTVARRRFIEREEEVYRALSIRQAAEKVEDELSLANLYIFNRALMTNYHSITQNQSKKSFLYSQIASFIGLALVAAGGTVVVAPTPTVAKITVAGLSGLGATMSGYISKTFTHSHELSIAQLNNFFQQPLVSNYFLLAERLSNELSSEAKNDARMEIISKILDSAPKEEREMAKSSRRKNRNLFTRSNNSSKTSSKTSGAED